MWGIKKLAAALYSVAAVGTIVLFEYNLLLWQYFDIFAVEPLDFAFSEIKFGILGLERDT